MKFKKNKYSLHTSRRDTLLFLKFLLRSCWVLVMACGLTWVAAQELYLGSGVAVLRLSIWGVQVRLPRGMWDLSSLTNDRTHVPYTGRQILYHWTNKEVPSPEFWPNKLPSISKIYKIPHFKICGSFYLSKLSIR